MQMEWVEERKFRKKKRRFNNPGGKNLDVIIHEVILDYVVGGIRDEKKPSGCKLAVQDSEHGSVGQIKFYELKLIWASKSNEIVWCDYLASSWIKIQWSKQALWYEALK